MNEDHQEYPEASESHLTTPLSTEQTENVATTGETEQLVDTYEMLHRPDFLQQAAYQMLQLEEPITVARVRQMVLENWQRYAEGQVAADQVTAEFAQNHLQQYTVWKESALGHPISHESIESNNLDGLSIFFCTNYLPIYDDIESRSYIPTTSEATGFAANRTTVHTAINHVVRPVTSGGRHFSWENSRYVLIAPLSSVVAQNGAPYAMMPEDTWWAVGASRGLELPPDTILVARADDAEATQFVHHTGMMLSSVDVKPYLAAECIAAKQLGTDIVSNPRDLQERIETIASKLNAFVGYHNAGMSGSGSESYVLAESIIASSFDGWEQETVQELNTTTGELSPSERWEKMVFLFGQGYFDGMQVGSESFPMYQSAYIRELVANQLKNGTGGLDYIQIRLQPNAQLIELLFEQIVSTHAQLPLMSDNQLRLKLAKIRKHLPMMPPQLLGNFFQTHAQALGIMPSKLLP